MVTEVQRNAQIQYSVSANQTDETSETSDVGAGTAVQEGEAPDIGSQIFAIMSALAQFKPTGDKDFEVRLASITQKMKDTQEDTQTERTKANQEVMQLNAEETDAKMKESIRKQEEAQAKAEDAKVWGLVSEIATYVGIGLMAAIGAALIISGVGAPLGGLMIASAVVSAAQIVDQKLVAEKNGGAGSLALMAAAIDRAIKGDDYDPDSKSARDLQMAMNITSAVIFAAIQITLAVMTGNVAAASNAINTIKAITLAVEVTTAVTSATADIGKNVVQLESAELQKDAEDAKADAMDLQAFDTTLQDMVDQALAMLMALGENFNAMLDRITEMMNDTGKSVQQTQLAG